MGCSLPASGGPLKKAFLCQGTVSTLPQTRNKDRLQPLRPPLLSLGGGDFSPHVSRQKNGLQPLKKAFLFLPTSGHGFNRAAKATGEIGFSRVRVLSFVFRGSDL
jgi:hypothetical protein